MATTPFLAPATAASVVVRPAVAPIASFGGLLQQQTRHMRASSGPHLAPRRAGGGGGGNNDGQNRRDKARRRRQNSAGGANHTTTAGGAFDGDGYTTPPSMIVNSLLRRRLYEPEDETRRRKERWIIPVAFQHDSADPIAEAAARAAALAVQRRAEAAAAAAALEAEAAEREKASAPLVDTTPRKRGGIGGAAAVAAAAAPTPLPQGSATQKKRAGRQVRVKKLTAKTLLHTIRSPEAAALASTHRHCQKTGHTFAAPNVEEAFHTPSSSSPSHHRQSDEWYAERDFAAASPLLEHLLRRTVELRRRSAEAEGEAINGEEGKGTQPTARGGGGAKTKQVAAPHSDNQKKQTKKRTVSAAETRVSAADFDFDDDPLMASLLREAPRHSDVVPAELARELLSAAAAGLHAEEHNPQRSSAPALLGKLDEGLLARRQSAIDTILARREAAFQRLVAAPKHPLMSLLVERFPAFRKVFPQHRTSTAHICRQVISAEPPGTPMLTVLDKYAPVERIGAPFGSAMHAQMLCKVRSGYLADRNSRIRRAVAEVAMARSTAAARRRTQTNNTSDNNAGTDDEDALFAEIESELLFEHEGSSYMVGRPTRQNGAATSGVRRATSEKSEKFAASADSSKKKGRPLLTAAALRAAPPTPAELWPEFFSASIIATPAVLAERKKRTTHALTVAYWDPKGLGRPAVPLSYAQSTAEEATGSSFRLLKNIHSELRKDLTLWSAEAALLAGRRAFAVSGLGLRKSLIKQEGGGRPNAPRPSLPTSRCWEEMSEEERAMERLLNANCHVDGVPDTPMLPDEYFYWEHL